MNCQRFGEVISIFLHKVVLTRAYSSLVPLETSPTLWPSWLEITFPKTSLMTTDTQTLRIHVLLGRLVHSFGGSRSEYLAMTDNIYTLPCCIYSSRWLSGKRSGHSRVQQTVSESPESFRPRARLPSPGKVGEYDEEQNWMTFNQLLYLKVCIQIKRQDYEVWPVLVTSFSGGSRKTKQREDIGQKRHDCFGLRSSFSSPR